MGIVTDKLPMYVENMPGGQMIVSTIDTVINWSRANSLWPLSFGTKCCAIEMLMDTGAAHQDLARFGAEVARATPRQADLLVIAGLITKKMAPRMRTLYEQMAEPRYVMATGGCAVAGGPYIYHSYHIVRGADEIVPVDVYVPGCPPRPEAFFYGLLTLQKMIKEGESIREPGVRRKPVLSCLPEGFTMDDIDAEMQRLLVEENVVDVQKEADNKIWAKRVEEWHNNKE